MWNAGLGLTANPGCGLKLRFWDVFCGQECKLVVCIYWVFKLRGNYKIYNYVVSTSIKMMEVETDLFDLGSCGDVLGVIVVFWGRSSPKERNFVLPNLRLKLTVLLEDGSFLGWVLGSWSLPKRQRASGMWFSSRSSFGVFHWQYSRRQFCFFFQLLEKKAFGVSVFKDLFLILLQIKCQHSAYLWKGIPLPTGNPLKVHWTQMGDCVLSFHGNTPVTSWYCIQFKADSQGFFVLEIALNWYSETITSYRLPIWLLRKVDLQIMCMRYKYLKRGKDNVVKK